MAGRRNETLTILKPLFGKKRDGGFEIQHLAVIPLHPDWDNEINFYPVREDLFSVEPTYISTVLSTLGQSIVPIVAMVPGENAVRCLGTGFFISADGLLITAAHVVNDPIERGYGGVRESEVNTWIMGDLNLGVMMMTNPVFQPRGWIFRRFEWASLLAQRVEHPLPFRGTELRLTSDTAICKVETPSGSVYQPLSVIQPGLKGAGLAEGKQAIAIGYAGMRDVCLDPEEDGFRPGDFHFRLHLAQGKILEHFHDNAVNRDVPTPGACFSASLKLPAGMSGSPIFDAERIYVHGVVSKGWEDEDGPISHGYGSMLAYSLGLPISPLGNISLLQLISQDRNGIPKLSFPDA